MDRLKETSVSDITVQTITEEGLVPLPVSGATNELVLVHIYSDCS